MTALKLYNSLTREKEEFRPIDPSNVRIYACGPTVYNFAHIGNARMAVVFDLLANVLRTLYPKVTYVSNITDIDDKIIAASKECGDPCESITKKYADIYNRDMAALGVRAPDIQPRATQHIPQMIALIEKLIEKGHAYEGQGHVLFNVPSFPAYGGLSGRSRDDQIAGARVEVAPYKKDPADFVLWKPSTPDQPGWDSPWGRGRPGWHIECSAMAEEHLGLPFDIHGGGADLKFPHHENEIAQSCCAQGHLNDLSAFAKVWVHNGFVTVNTQKMAKSEGNTRLVHDLLRHYDGETLRLALLSAQYSQPLDWTENLLQQTRKTLDRLYQALREISDVPQEKDSDQLDNPVLEALCDDLNTPKAIAALGQLSKTAAQTKSPADKAALSVGANLLGVLQKNADEWLGYGQESSEVDAVKIENLLQQRQDARKDKNFARADEIRDELTKMGIAIEDTPQGPVWKKI
ncbi:MAG: cysteine--tRNA ligase [Alphaproteobacteria bacterium]|nr:cysteine--tRNA ligase [Alphaproteobacteria bacterium]MCB9975321.1 cysteine--tRNA ligase [Rhodospirillales bacterium]